MENIFTKALKYNTPATLACVVVYYLVFPITSNVEFIKSNPNLSAFIAVLIVNFAVILLFASKKNNISKFNQNSIVDNDVEGNVALGKKAKEIQGNKISKNKIKGNLTIGGE